MPSDRTVVLPGDAAAAHVATASVARSLLPGFLGLAVAVLALELRPAAPLDELRYLGVAWEMWLRGDFLVPHLNGAAYAHKPPLLFWLIHAGWALFGVNDWWPRLVPGLAGFAAVTLVGRLARQLWPADAGGAAYAPWILAGSLAWVFCVQMVMFDVLLTAWVALGLGAAWTAAHRRQRRDFLLLGLALGGGLLTKGPVILMHLLLPAALAPAWHPPLRHRAWRWYAGLLAALVLGAALALAWAVPAALRGGPDYAGAILWHQTADRMEDSFAHARAWWYYLPVLPALALPWTAMPAVWRRLPSVAQDPALRFLGAWVGSVLVALSAVSGKQPHYLLPLLPALALIAGRLSGAAGSAGRADRLALAAVPALLALAGAAYLVVLARGLGAGWNESGAFWPLLVLPACLWAVSAGTVRTLVHRAAVTMMLLLAFLLAGLVHNPVAAGHDLRRAAARVAGFRQSGAQVFAMGHYQGKLTWLGRLREPVGVVARNDVAAWAAGHPGAYILAFKDVLPEGVPAEFVAAYPYRDHQLRIWRVPERG